VPQLQHRGRHGLSARRNTPGRGEGGQQDPVTDPSTSLLSEKSATFAFYVSGNTGDATPSELEFYMNKKVTGVIIIC
jgi:hypothetical protein